MTTDEHAALLERALNITLLALRLIANEDKMQPEQWLKDHGVRVEFWEHNAEKQWEYLRRMDYEIASMATHDAYELLRRAKGQA